MQYINDLWRTAMKRLLASNEYNRMDVGGIIVEAQSFSGKRALVGKTQYCLMIDGYPPKVKWPAKRTMHRLADKFLQSDYKEIERSNLVLNFLVRPSVPLEDRAAFFAAVATHTKYCLE